MPANTHLLIAVANQPADLKYAVGWIGGAQSVVSDFNSPCLVEIPPGADVVRVQFFRRAAADGYVLLATFETAVRVHGTVHPRLYEEQTDAARGPWTPGIAVTVTGVNSSGLLGTEDARACIADITRRLEAEYARLAPNEAVACLATGYGTPVSVYFHLNCIGAFSEKVLLDMFWFACSVQGVKPEAFKSQPAFVRAQILSRMCSAIPCTLEYAPDMTMRSGRPVPCNHYGNPATTWSDDCEGAGFLGICVFENLYMYYNKPSSELYEVANFAGRYRLFAATTKIANLASDQHHTHALCISYDDALPAILFECTTPTQGAVGPHIDGELPLDMRVSGTVNNWYGNVVCLFEIGKPFAMPFFVMRKGALGYPLADILSGKKGYTLYQLDAMYTPVAEAYMQELIVGAACVSVDAIVQTARVGRPREGYAVKRLPPDAELPATTFFTIRVPGATVVYY